MGPLVLPKNSANGCGWANWPHQRNTANGVMWAQCCSRDMLPKAVNGSAGAAKRFCQWSWMGPIFFHRHAAKSCELAHWCCQIILPMVADGPTFSLIEILPMVSYGPSVVPETCCQKLCMGPSALPKNAAGCHRWTSHFSKEMLPMVSYGPIVGA